MGLQAVDTRATWAVGRSGPLVRLAGKGETAVGSLLDQPVDEQRIQGTVPLSRVGDPGYVEFGASDRRRVATQHIQ